MKHIGKLKMWGRSERWEGDDDDDDDYELDNAEHDYDLSFTFLRIEK